MPYDFASPVIVVIYSLHAGGLKRFFTALVYAEPYEHRMPVRTRTGSI